MTEIVVTVQVRKTDWSEFQKLWMAEFEKDSPRSLGKKLADAILVLALVSVFYVYRADFHWPTALVVAVIGFMFIGYFFRSYARATEAATPRDNGLFLGQHTYRFTPEKIYSKGPLNLCEYEWDLVNSVRDTENLIILMIDSAAALILPKRDIEDPAELVEKVKILAQH